MIPSSFAGHFIKRIRFASKVIRVSLDKVSRNYPVVITHLNSRQRLRGLPSRKETVYFTKDLKGSTRLCTAIQVNSALGHSVRPLACPVAAIMPGGIGVSIQAKDGWKVKSSSWPRLLLPASDVAARSG